MYTEKHKTLILVFWNLPWSRRKFLLRASCGYAWRWRWQIAWRRPLIALPRRLLRPPSVWNSSNPIIVFRFPQKWDSKIADQWTLGIWKAGSFACLSHLAGEETCKAGTFAGATSPEKRERRKDLKRWNFRRPQSPRRRREWWRSLIGSEVLQPLSCCLVPHPRST